MKTLLTTLLVLCATSAVALAQTPPVEEYVQTPLPGGPLVGHTADYAEWVINYSYAVPKPHPSTDGAPVPPPPPTDPSLPRRLLVTKTKPLWHARITKIDGSFEECWWDGLVPIMVNSLQNMPVPLMLDTPGVHIPPYLDFMGNRDFTDIDWVSPSNYLGTSKGTPYWVFQLNGVKVWIDSNSRLPVKWQSGLETRTYEFSPPPGAKLVMPPDVARVSKQNAYIHAIYNNHPPRGA